MQQPFRALRTTREANQVWENKTNTTATRFCCRTIEQTIPNEPTYKSVSLFKKTDILSWVLEKTTNTGTIPRRCCWWWTTQTTTTKPRSSFIVVSDWRTTSRLRTRETGIVYTGNHSSHQIAGTVAPES